MAKTFVPQLARMALRMNNYIIKHQAKLDQYITDPNAQQALTSCSTCLATLARYLIRETP